MKQRSSKIFEGAKYFDGFTGMYLRELPEGYFQIDGKVWRDIEGDTVESNWIKRLPIN